MHTIDVGRLIHNMRSSDSIYHELINEYADDEIPWWVMRTGDEPTVERGDTPSASGEPDGQPSAGGHTAPESRKSPVQGQGSRETADDDPITLTDDDQALMRVDHVPPGLTKDDVLYLGSLNITQMQDDIGRWMLVTCQADGSILMTPVNVQARVIYCCAHARGCARDGRHVNGVVRALVNFHLSTGAVGKLDDVGVTQTLLRRSVEVHRRKRRNSP